MLAAVLPHTARQFARAIIMPNLKPPVTTTAMAQAYRERIVAALPAGMQFEPLMTLYLTDNTPPDEIRRARESGWCMGQAVSGGRHDQLRRGRDRHHEVLQNARSDAAKPACRCSCMAK
jgi:hypothetical protein